MDAALTDQHANDDQLIVVVDDDDDSSSSSGGDLSGDDWEDTKRLFRKLRDDKHASLWDALAARSGRAPIGNSKRSTTTLEKSTNRRRRHHSAAKATQTSGRKVAICQDDCCFPASFVPVDFLMQKHAATTGADTGSQDEPTAIDADEHDMLDSVASDLLLDQADELDIPSDEEEISDESSDKLVVVSFEAHPSPLPEKVPIPSAAAKPIVLEIDSDEYTDESGTRNIPAHRRAKNSLSDASVTSRHAKPTMVLENGDSWSSDDDDDKGVRSPPKCKSPRLLFSFEGLTLASDENFVGDDELELDEDGADVVGGAVGIGDGSDIHDDDSDSSSESSWNDNIRTGLAAKPPSTDISKQEVIVLDSDDDEEDGTAMLRSPEQAKARGVSKRKAKGQNLTGKHSFYKNREELALLAFKQLDKKAFGGRLGAAGVNIMWSNRLTSTAGKTVMKRRRGVNEDKEVTDIVLSASILDCEGRLQSTMLHEMCHAAAWIVDKNHNPPHGPIFKKWARLAQDRTGIAVTTTHTYNIARYAWTCTTVECNVTIQRPTKSFNPAAFVCSKCKGKFVQVDIATGHPLQPRKKKPSSKYNLFVKEHSKSVREDLASKNLGRKVSQAEVMAEMAVLWKQQSVKGT